MSLSVDEINDTIRYTNWTAYARTGRLEKSSQAAAEWEELVQQLASEDVTVRGAYDLTGFRGDADLLLWIHAETAEKVQDALHRFDHTEVGRHTRQTWSGMALHRPAEFNRRHVPGFMMGKEPGECCVFTRLSAPTTGICWRRRNAGRCWSNTAKKAPSTPRLSPALSRRLVSATTSGYWRWSLMYCTTLST